MVDRCISCGEIIPEGIGWVCPICNNSVENDIKCIDDTRPLKDFKKDE